MQATIQSINLISTNPNIRNGRPCIAGTSIEVSVNEGSTSWKPPFTSILMKDDLD